MVWDYRIEFRFPLLPDFYGNPFMSDKTRLPFGSWPSAIQAQDLVRAGVNFSEPRCVGGREYWLERRPREGGRSVAVVLDEHGQIRDCIPEGYNIRSRAHEYGGGAWAVEERTSGPMLWFSNDPGGGLFRCEDGREPLRITEDGPWRFADLLPDPARNRLIAVREDHKVPKGREPINTLVAIAPDGQLTTLAYGHDFFASPCLSRDGKQLAWLSWDHPNLPWDHTTLWLANLDAEGRPVNSRAVAGTDHESIFQPSFDAQGRLVFASDRSDWWNLYRREFDGSLRALHPMEAEFGLPQWVFGMRTWAWLPDGRITCAYTQGGIWRQAILDPDSSEFTPLDTDLVDHNGIDAGPQGLLVVGARRDRPQHVARIATDGTVQILRDGGGLASAPGDLSLAVGIDYRTEGGAPAHALFYAPANARYRGPEGERPPVIVRIHGGPTGATGAGFNPQIQFWTTRGFAVVDVNYRGSTGYGRRYRESLYGQWGAADVDDCIHAVRQLDQQGLVDGQRAAIRGSSAGGYTTLAALAFRDFFAVGASLYGIGDLELLIRDTHKFEARYLDQLIGPYPQQKDRYRQRSPIHAVERLSAPVIFFQGDEDKVVPPNQAETMVRALQEKGVPVAHIVYPGEGHGFRQAAHIQRTLEAELYFYARIFGIELQERLEPVMEIQKGVSKNI